VPERTIFSPEGGKEGERVDTIARGTRSASSEKKKKKKGEEEGKTQGQRFFSPHLSQRKRRGTTSVFLSVRFEKKEKKGERGNTDLL